MGAIAFQITSLTIVYSIVYSDADQRKHQSSASLAFVRGIPRTNGQLRGNLMTSSWGSPASCHTGEGGGGTKYLLQIYRSGHRYHTIVTQTISWTHLRILHHRRTRFEHQKEEKNPHSPSAPCISWDHHRWDRQPNSQYTRENYLFICYSYQTIKCHTQFRYHYSYEHPKMEQA